MFQELEDLTFDTLDLGAGCLGFDEQKILLRGAVTRIGGFSTVGKSKMAYFFAHRLLKQGYRGAVFSTEVRRPIVLANLLVVQSGQGFWDIIEHRYTPTEEDRRIFDNLTIYDVTDATNSMKQIRALLTGHLDRNERPDFIVIDFVQAVMPSEKSQGEYEAMSHYALEAQSLAQEFNICLIDLSQISNAGLNDEHKSSGMIPFKGSGHLYSSADIGILLKRDRTDPDSNIMTFDIRKHKYMPSKELQLVVDYKKGTFEVFGEQFNEHAPVIHAAFLTQDDLSI